MGETEREKKTPTFCSGINRLSPLVGRELGVLLMTLMEERAGDRVDTLLHAWRELAREERWWLYSKAVAAGQPTRCGLATSLVPRAGRKVRHTCCPNGGAPKKSLWEHREEFAAETLPTGQLHESSEIVADAPNAVMTTGTVPLAETKRSYIKDTSRKAVKRDDPQRKLF